MARKSFLKTFLVTGTVCTVPGGSPICAVRLENAPRCLFVKNILSSRSIPKGPSDPRPSSSLQKSRPRTGTSSERGFGRRSERYFDQ